MGLKGTRRGAAGIGHQHRSLHLQEALAIQITPDAGYHFGTLEKGILDLAVHNQIHVSLAVAEIRVGQTVELFRKDLQALDSSVSSVTWMEISPVLVLKTVPFTPTMSPISSFLNSL